MNTLNSKFRMNRHLKVAKEFFVNRFAFFLAFLKRLKSCFIHLGVFSNSDPVSLDNTHDHGELGEIASIHTVDKDIENLFDGKISE